MKKLIAILLALVMILTLSACSSGTRSETVTASPEASTNTVEGTDEDWQNPVMNFIGNYDNGGTVILVEAEGADGAKFTVEEPLTDTEKNTFTFSGSIDLDTLRVTYSNSTKTVQALDTQGVIVDERVEYTDGAGMIIFHEDGTLEWQDENEAERFVGSNIFSYVLPE